MDYSKIKVADDGAVRIITLADPARMNAAGVDMAQELTDAFRQVDAEGSGVPAVVLTGEGRGFCSGANLSGGGAGGWAPMGGRMPGRRWRRSTIRWSP